MRVRGALPAVHPTPNATGGRAASLAEAVNGKRHLLVPQRHAPIASLPADGAGGTLQFNRTQAEQVMDPASPAPVEPTVIGPCSRCEEQDARTPSAVGLANSRRRAPGGCMAMTRQTDRRFPARAALILGFGGTAVLLGGVVAWSVLASVSGAVIASVRWRSRPATRRSSISMAARSTRFWFATVTAWPGAKCCFASTTPFFVPRKPFSRGNTRNSRHGGTGWKPSFKAWTRLSGVTNSPRWRQRTPR